MPTPTTLGPTDVSLSGIPDSVQRTFQRKAFFAERRHWVFYVDDMNNLIYDSSPIDSELWEGPQPLAGANSGAEFSVFVQESPPLSPSFVHLVYSDAVGGSPIFYVRGTLVSDGTILWDAPDEAVPFDLGFQYEQLGITMGYDGNIYIVYTKVPLADVNQTTPYVCQSTTADGTWTTGLGYPLQITAVQDASWIPLVSPYWQEVMVVYTTANGNIYSRVLSGGAWGLQVDTGYDIGQDPQKISIVSETRVMGLNGSSGKVGRAVYVAFQGGDWDLYSIRYESGAWQGAPATTIEVIGAFRSANPMLTILDSGDSDGDHMPATLYCFWTPTTDSPQRETVTYRLSRDFGDTWTDEAGDDVAEEWIDESGDGFEVQQSGSAYSFSDPDYYGKFYIGLVYVVHRMPPAIRHAGLVFEDPSVDLLGELDVRQETSKDLKAYFNVTQAVDLKGEFIVRHTGAANLRGIFDVGQPRSVDLPGEFIVQHEAAQNLFGEFVVSRSGAVTLLGEFIVRHEATQDLKGEFFVNQASVDLYAEFIVPQSTLDLKGEFIVQHDQDENLKGEFIAQHEQDENLKGQFFVLNTGAANLRGIFDVRQETSEDLKAYFNVTQAVDLKGQFIIRRSGAANLRAIFIVRQPGAVDLPCQFRIDKDFLSKGLNVSVYQDLGVIG